MANEEDFKVFISWSGPLAKGVAGALRDWLPTMFDRIEPWFSDTDIPAGATWFGEIQDRLNSSDFGIVIITTENLNKPWLNFEAGSLSKKLKDEIGRVTPILVNFNEVTQLTGHPLEQYNAVLLEKDGIRRLCDSIARSAERNTASVQLRFEQMWERLDSEISAAKSAAGSQPAPPEVSEPERLDALTASVRSLEATVAQLIRANTLANPRRIRTGTPRVTVTPAEADNVRDEISRIVNQYRPIRMLSGITSAQGARLNITVVGEPLSENEHDDMMAEIAREVPIPVELQIFTEGEG